MLGYSKRSKGYRVYNTETWIMEESISVRFDDKLGSQKSKQGESSVDIEVQITGTKDRSLKNKSSEHQPNTKEDITNITTNS